MGLNLSIRTKHLLRSKRQYEKINQVRVNKYRVVSVCNLKVYVDLRELAILPIIIFFETSVLEYGLRYARLSANNAVAPDEALASFNAFRLTLHDNLSVAEFICNLPTRFKVLQKLAFGNLFKLFAAVASVGFAFSPFSPADTIFLHFLFLLRR